jgi:hypothetical protein
MGAAPTRRSFAQSHDVARVARRFQFPIHGGKRTGDNVFAAEHENAGFHHRCGDEDEAGCLQDIQVPFTDVPRASSPA